ncbi:protein phosphatase CheZ [Phaeovibrio sulfidiphilus]|uniref:Protein phosphatase CheZ n=1 Tax=Phaeovibrio sulfidiphilus TaxID=1220600 RepID=A0A8J7CPW1_9PROT|nr:protein phosphatase CheZ [Phaeovibrio sulfidiphilus]
MAGPTSAWGEAPAGCTPLTANPDSLTAERDALRAERDALKAERDALRAERDALAAERDALKTERDALKAERASRQAEIDIILHELALLISRNEEGDRLTVAGNELRAVVSTTEDATGTILGASEILMGLLREQAGRQAAAPGAQGPAGFSAAESLVIAIMEACTFQDLTGQRIDKVVSALRFLEEHIHAMVDLFGEDALPAPQTAAVPENDESRLLNGPQDKERSISQAEIDALFG